MRRTSNDESAEHLPGDLEAGLVDECTKAGAEVGQMTMQRAAVHREQRADTAGAGVARHQRRLQHAAYLGRKVVAVPGLERVDLLLQQAPQRIVDFGQLPAQPARGEHQPVPVGVETQRGMEDAAIRFDVIGLAVREGRPLQVSNCGRTGRA